MFPAFKEDMVKKYPQLPFVCSCFALFTLVLSGIWTLLSRYKSKFNQEISWKISSLHHLMSLPFRFINPYLSCSQHTHSPSTSSGIRLAHPVSHLYLSTNNGKLFSSSPGCFNHHLLPHRNVLCYVQFWRETYEKSNYTDWKN